VFFRQGAYQPGNHGGQELLAHELTHVVQQNGGISCNDTQQHSGSKKIARTGGKACTANSQLHHAKVPDTLSTSTPLLQAMWPFDGPSIFSWEFWGYPPAKTSSGTKQLKPRPKAVSKGKSERNGEGDKDGALKNEGEIKGDFEKKFMDLIKEAEEKGEALSSQQWSAYEKTIKNKLVELKDYENQEDIKEILERLRNAYKYKEEMGIEDHVFEAFQRGAQKEAQEHPYLTPHEKEIRERSRKESSRDKEEEEIENRTHKGRTQEQKAKAVDITVNKILEMVQAEKDKPREVYGKKDANVAREGSVKCGSTFRDVEDDIKEEVYQKLLKLKGNTMFGGLIYIVKKSPPNIYNVTLHKVDRKGKDTFETLANVHIEVSN
jgi:Domain of unknown function (DUF4157)